MESHTPLLASAPAARQPRMLTDEAACGPPHSYGDAASRHSRSAESAHRRPTCPTGAVCASAVRTPESFSIVCCPTAVKEPETRKEACTTLPSRARESFISRFDMYKVILDKFLASVLRECG